MFKQKILLISIIFISSFIARAQPTGKAAEIYSLLNEARSNPQLFLTKYRTKINEYEPKFVSLLEKSSPIAQIIWDDALAENCRQRVYGTLNPEYRGDKKICGYSSSSGSGYFSSDALYFICNSYVHIMNEDDMYFAFYIDTRGHAIKWGKSCVSKKYVFEFNGILDSSRVDFQRISTASYEYGLSKMDKEMVKEINFVRQYPKVYATIVAKHLSDESKSWYGINKEEFDAGNELIAELNNMSPAPILYPKDCVYQAAKKHGEDCRRRGFTDHTGSDGSSPFARISNFCNGIKGNENIVGGRKNARILVIQLLIDAGISSRGHRYNMLNPIWKYIGCYGWEGQGMYNYVQNFANDQK